MNHHSHPKSSSLDISRRELLRNTTLAATASAFSTLALPRAYADEKNTIQVALVGCGGRGTGAASNALSNTSGPTKLVAMADVFSDRLENSHKTLTSRHKDKVDVPGEKQFIGFDAYKKAMDALRPGDVVILTTPPTFRWLHYTYAIEKGLNVFMEKPVTIDGPTSRKMFKLNEEAKSKGLKVGVGLMCRHCIVRGEQYKRIQDGAIGDLILLRAYRMAGPTASAFSEPKPDNMSELDYQIRRFHSFLWLSGGAFSDFLIHNIDECCWMKNDWPIEARASGGRHYRGNYIDQNFDHYSVEYTFKDGTKLQLEGRTMRGCQSKFASYAHGSKGSAIISTAGHTPARSRLHSDQNFSKDSLLWNFRQKEPNPYQLEWNNLIAAIINDLEYNEVDRGVEASLVTAMGRMAAHTGQVITRDQILNHEHAFAPNLQELKLGGESPLKANEDGKYPVPQPGIVTKREY